MVIRTAQHPPRRAFALLDVLVGGMVLGVALVAIIGITSRAIRAQARGERVEKAAMLADELLYLVLATGPERYEDEFELNGEAEWPFDGYFYELEIDWVSEGRPYEVTAIVSWESPLERDLIVVRTLIAPRLGDEPDPERAPERPVER